MRAGLGLVGILVTLGAIIMIFKSFTGPHTDEVLKVRRDATEQVSQIAGIKDGVRITDSITMQPQMSGSNVDSLLVTAIMAGGPMETYFGLKRDDSIVEALNMRLKDYQDGEIAKGFVFQSYQSKQPIVVIRDGERLTLPATNAPAVANQSTPAPAGQQQPAASNPPPQKQPKTANQLMDQLKLPTAR